jgi:hypothetical protein
MASIVRAETIVDLPWREGAQRQVVFEFELDDGTVHQVGPIYPYATRDLVALRAAKGAYVLERLAQAEVEELLS